MSEHKHVFENHCVAFEEILKDPDFKRMLRVVEKQAKTKEAKLRVDFGKYKDYGEDKWSPLYFGMFVEWYAEQYLNFFGHLYNIADVKMYDAVGATYEDYGIDGAGITMSNKKASKQSRVANIQGGPVYIQVKGTMDYTKEHKPNDGSRLPNFTTNAMSTAIKNGTAYYTRYVLFTTAKGIEFTLSNMWNNMVEVIGFKDIHQLTNNNYLFLNALRTKIGLDPIEIPTPPLDAEASFNWLTSE